MWINESDMDSADKRRSTNTTGGAGEGWHTNAVEGVALIDATEEHEDGEAWLGSPIWTPGSAGGAIGSPLCDDGKKFGDDEEEEEEDALAVGDDDAEDEAADGDEEFDDGDEFDDDEDDIFEDEDEDDALEGAEDDDEEEDF